ncbi:MAG: TrkH family potassium uptake protein [Desulfitobacteriaceae bacterium]|nr:TrkH family potassium uptake protein [Desulfitobacteriaceae bacterium]MDD4400679.1 TrkH family potassium uptake protein [Desulfitobacteriaceae bacterium]
MNMDAKFITPSRVLVVGFALLILLGALLLALPQATQDGNRISFLNAIFTSTSAVCITGLSVVDVGMTFSLFGQAVILMLIQVGGLGFMTFAALFALILGKKITLKERLLLKEALNQVSLAGIVRLTKYVIQVSFAIEALGAFILTLRWSAEFGLSKAFFYGLFHAVSAFNNAGFDLFGNFSSLMTYSGDVIINLTIMFLTILGGLGFTVLVGIYTYRERKLSLHARIVLQASGILVLLGAVIILLLEYLNPLTLGPLPWGTKVLAAFFQAVSPRSAGFSTVNIFNMYDTTLLFMVMLMFIGASPGSTGGGIKTTTFIAIIYSVLSTFQGKPYVVIKERTIPFEIIRKALAITISLIFLIIFVTFILSITEEASLFSLFFEVTSALTTTGLSLGITPALSAFGKVMIIIAMFIGRVGLLTLVYFLAQRTKNPIAHIKFPDEQILIG